MRWVLLDEITEVKRGEYAVSKGRIPEAPVSAEVLMIEMMAQTGGVILGAEKDYREDVVFTKIQNSRFLSGWKPGDEVEIRCCCENLRPEGAWFEGTIKGQHGVVAESRFLLMSVGHLKSGRQDSITFHRNFMNHFNVREKVC